MKAGAIATVLLAMLLCICVWSIAQVRRSNEGPVYVPKTVSPRAQNVLRRMTGPQGLDLPDPDDIEGWKKIRNYTPPQLKPIFEETNAALKRYPFTMTHREIAGV